MKTKKRETLCCVVLLGLGPGNQCNSFCRGLYDLSVGEANETNWPRLDLDPDPGPLGSYFRRYGLYLDTFLVLTISDQMQLQQAQQQKKTQII